MAVPNISIIMSVKNAEKYLAQCLDSILHQSKTDWELIAVDDGSTDKSIQILGQFEDKDPRIKVFNNPDRGIVPALAYAFSRSSGKCITRMDADDIMPENKLQTLYHFLGNRKKVVATGKVKYFSDKQVSEGYVRYEKWLNELLEENSFTENIYRECTIASPNWMVCRECFENDIDLSALVYPEDYDLVFEWTTAGYVFEGVLRITHLWREHQERTSRNSENYQQAAFFRLKTNRFIQQFADQIQGVQLIGKGQKGKLVARILEQNNVQFEWFDLKPGGNQQSVLSLKKRLSILSNWPKDEKTQKDIIAFMGRMNLTFGEDVWLF